MAKSICGQTGFATVNTPDASTWYYQLTRQTNSDTETHTQLPVRNAGTISNFQTRVNLNTINANPSAVMRVRLNLANSALTVSYSNNQTGFKEDTANSSSTAATDEIDVSVVATSVSGSQNVSLANTLVQFVPTSPGCVSFLGSGGSWTISTASTTVYWPIQGGLSNNTSTERNPQFTLKTSFRARNIWTNVLANTRVTDSVIRSRKNGSDGGQTITYTAAQTGQKEDLVGTDSLNSGDLFCLSATTGIGVGSIAGYAVGETLENVGNTFLFMAGIAAGTTGTFNNTYYMGPLSMNGVNASNVCGIWGNFPVHLRGLQCYVSANSITTSDQTFRVDINLVLGNQILTYSAGQTGYKEDTLNTDIAPSGVTGRISYRWTLPNTSGTCTIHSLGCHASEAGLAESLIIQQAVKRAAFF